MASDWQLKTIAECASNEPYSTQIGPFGKALMANEYTETGIPVLRGVNVNFGRFHDDDYVFVSEETADKLSKFESYPGDVILVHKGTLGKIGLMPKKRKHKRYIMGNSMMRVKCDPTKLLPEYLYYWLSSGDGQQYIFSRVSQVGVPQLQTPLTTLRQASLPIPSIDEQRAIVDILGSLDEALERNQKMNQTLESMTRAIFKSWFVDFDPVRAKAEGREPEGMDAGTAALFPSEFEETPLGSVPCGWNVVNLGELAEFAYGKPLKAENRNGGTVPVMGSNGRVGWHDEALVRGPGIVVGRKGNPGTVTWVDSDFFPIDTAFFVRPRNLTRGLHILKNQLDLLNLPDLSADSAVPGLNRQIAYQAKLANPPKFIANLFEDIVGPLVAKTAQNKGLIATLAALRDTLLPRLISGKLRVPEAEAMLMGGRHEV